MKSKYVIGFVAIIILLSSIASFSLGTTTVPFDKHATYIATAQAGAPCIIQDPDTGNYLLFSTTTDATRTIYKCWSNDINTTTWYDSTSVFSDGSTWCHSILKYPNGTAAKVNGDYWMFYAGSAGAYIRAANPSVHGNLNSTSWTYNSTVGSIVTKGAEGWHDDRIAKLGITAMLDDDGSIIIIYEGGTTTPYYEGLGLVTSDDDCVSWNVYGENPVYEISGNTNDWDGDSIDYPSLTKYKDTYIMLYCGQNISAPYDPGEWTPEQVGVLTSSNLTSWTSLETVYEPIFYPNGTSPNYPYSYGPWQGWDWDGTSDLSHFFVGDKMYLFYEGETPYHVGIAWFDNFFVNLGIQDVEESQFISINDGLNETTIYDSTPTINWTVVTSASQYWLQIDNNVDFTSPEVNLSDINQYIYPSNCVIDTNVSFTIPDDKALPTYQQYYCRVRACSR